MFRKTIAHSYASAGLRPRATQRPTITMPANNRNGSSSQNAKSRTNSLSLDKGMSYFLMTSYSPMNPGAMRLLLKPHQCEIRHAHEKSSLTEAEIDGSKTSMSARTVKYSGISSTILSSTLSIPKATEHTTTPLGKIVADFLCAAPMDGQSTITQEVSAINGTTAETKTHIPARPWVFELPTPLRPCEGTTYYTSFNTEHNKDSAAEHAKPNVFQYILYGTPAPEEHMMKNGRISAVVQKILYGVHVEGEHVGLMSTAVPESKSGKGNA